MNKIFNYLLIISLVIIITPFFSFGQSTSNGNFLEISIIPKNPEPFQTVKTTIKSSLYDLDRSKITWLVDGLEKKTEIGLKEYNTLAGKNGQKTIVKAIVELSDGTKEIETSFTPSLVDLIFESLSYTPPFYKGRALNPSQGSVIVTAIPELVKSNGEKELAQNIFYSWKKDGTPQLPSSGMGKNVLTFTGTVPVRDTIIEVSVSSLDKNLSASKQITIINVDPKIIFYENSPIYGIMLNKGIKGVINMLTDEFSVIAVPYFFNGLCA